MREIELKVLSELMKNSRVSDRELAKKIGSSQPTVTRASAPTLTARAMRIIRNFKHYQYSLFAEFINL
jgi:DNA-binding Lrp family transcriptional regulator